MSSRRTTSSSLSISVTDNQVNYSDTLFLNIQTADIKLTGYPASDPRVRNWFKSPCLSPTQSDIRCSAFLTALLEKTLEIVKDPQRQIRNAIMESTSLRDGEKAAARQSFPSTLQEQFRLFMTVGQTFSKQGDLRIEFYDRVVERANEVGFQLYPPGNTNHYSIRCSKCPQNEYWRASSVCEVS